MASVVFPFPQVARDAIGLGDRGYVSDSFGVDRGSSTFVLGPSAESSPAAASPHKAADALVFCKDNGEGDDYRDAGEDFRAPVTTIRIRIVWHDPDWQWWTRLAK